MKLNPAISDKYELIDWPSPKAASLVFGKFGKVEPGTMTEQQAESLLNKGFKKLKRKEKPKPPPKKMELAD